MREIPYSTPPYHEDDLNKMEKPEYLSMLRNAFTERLEENFTRPDQSHLESLEGAEIMARLQTGEKVEADRQTYDALTATGQDYRLTPDEIDVLRREIFTEESIERFKPQRG